MMKTIVWYTGVATVFGMLAFGSMKYTSQFAEVDQKMSSKQADVPFRISHGWSKK